MPRKLPPLNALRAFEAAGRHQSFSRAAEELNVSHSAISRHVRGLEHRLKVQLFRDLPRGLELTPDGAGYLARMTPVFDTIAEATDVLAERPSGLITLSCEPLFAAKWLIPNLSTFRSSHPNVELRLEATQELADVDHYATDLAIRFFNSGVPDQPASLISDAPLFPFASPDLIPGPVESPRQLLGHPLLKDRSTDTWERWFAIAGKVGPDEVPQPAWRISTVLAFEMAVTGQGVILCSAEVAQSDVASGRLVRCSDVGIQEGGYFLVNAQGALRRKAVRAFQGWILGRGADMRQNPGVKGQPDG